MYKLKQINLLPRDRGPIYGIPASCPFLLLFYTAETAPGSPTRLIVVLRKSRGWEIYKQIVLDSGSYQASFLDEPVFVTTEESLYIEVEIVVSQYNRWLRNSFRPQWNGMP